MIQRHNAHGYSIRDLQSLLGVSRRVLAGLIAAGFVSPSRGRRNELRFSFRDVALLRTAVRLQSAKIPSRRILHALSRLQSELSEDTPMSRLRISAVGDAVAVRTGHTQWDANSGQLLLDFAADEKSDDTRSGVTDMDSSPVKLKAREKLAARWYEVAERSQENGRKMRAERAYRKALELSPAPHYYAYANLGALLSQEESRCSDALKVFEAALEHFAEVELLHYNRAILLEHAHRLEEAAASFQRCVELNPHSDEALYDFGVILTKLDRWDEAAKIFVECLRLNPEHEDAEDHLKKAMAKLEDDKRAIIRHLSALRRLNV